MSTIASATRKLSQKQVDILRALQVGQRIRIVQMMRVGAKKWQATVTGVFRNLNYLATGVTTDRVPEDDVVVPVVHFSKDNGELSSITLDENTVVEMV